ncbi:MAG TPA: hypothetical protein V6D19_24660 [Stenomitos sp.]
METPSGYRQQTLKFIPMNRQTAQIWLTSIEEKRDLIVRLLEQPNLGTLRIDANQALEEMDDLIDEFRRTFPPEPTSL